MAYKELHKHPLVYYDDIREAFDDGTETAECDICEAEIDLMVFHCEECEYDVCPSCMGKHLQKHAKHHHPLTKYTTCPYDPESELLAQCDTCGAAIEVGDKLYHCDVCKTYDNCEECYKLYQAPHPHPMNYFEHAPYEKDFFVCDYCHAPNKKKPGYHCDTCGESDACPTCYKLFVAPSGPQPPQNAYPQGYPPQAPPGAYPNPGAYPAQGVLPPGGHPPGMQPPHPVSVQVNLAVNPAQPGQYVPPQSGQPGQYPPGHPSQQGPGGQYPPQTQPGQYPPMQPGQPGQYPPGQYPPPQSGQPGQYPPGPTAPAPGQYPPQQPGQPGQYPPPGQYLPQQGAPGQYPHQTQPGQYAPTGQPGQYPPGQYPPQTQPGGQYSPQLNASLNFPGQLGQPSQYPPQQGAPYLQPGQYPPTQYPPQPTVALNFPGQAGQYPPTPHGLYPPPSTPANASLNFPGQPGADPSLNFANLSLSSNAPNDKPTPY